MPAVSAVLAPHSSAFFAKPRADSSASPSAIAATIPRHPRASAHLRAASGKRLRCQQSEGRLPAWFRRAILESTSSRWCFPTKNTRCCSRLPSATVVRQRAGFVRRSAQPISRSRRARGQRRPPGANPKIPPTHQRNHQHSHPNSQRHNSHPPPQFREFLHQVIHVSYGV